MTSIGRLFTKLTVASLLWIASPAHAVTFKIDDQTVTSGDSISTSITVSGFSSVTSFQFTLIWNPDLLDYSSAGSFGLDFLSGSSFGTTQVSQGKLTVSWDDSSLLGKTLSDGAAIFSVNFNVIGNNGSSAFINLGDDPTEREVTVDFSVAGFDSQSGKIQIGTPQASSPPIHCIATHQYIRNLRRKCGILSGSHRNRTTRVSMEEEWDDSFRKDGVWADADRNSVERFRGLLSRSEQ